MSRRARVHRLTEDEWNDLSQAADEAQGLALVLSYGCITSIYNDRDRRQAMSGCASALARILDNLLARLDAVEPSFR